ncbi:hypothetical protein EJ04DRAFT_604003 [Polyplosphaeria fusca]|uniref:Pheromone alpha factor receptor n=1 Tax=Polyplosphaeria fusca TaxID=682080 RepID=A0A9P4QWT8_9PLEO|nr:hypothetical protein EJ04DRAFT_604003 [Polyplosphaeria fusca]
MSNSTNATLPANFDPYNQAFTLLLPDGTPIEVNTSDLNFMRSFGMRLAINMGSQVGASIMLLAVLLVLTRREKMRSWVFIMNTLCLLTNAIRAILSCLYLTGNWFNPYAFLTGDFSKVTSNDMATSIASNIMTLLLVVFIFVSLSIQVWIVCVTTPRLQQLLIMSATTLVALVAIGFRLAVVVVTSHRTLHYTGWDDKHLLIVQMYISQAIAIWVFCVVFTFKLGLALLQRKRLGMTQFGPMQIIFIMGCQTMIIPAIFTCLEFYDKIPELGTQTLTVVCIFLPLSAIWAGVSTSDSNVAVSGANSHQRLLRDQFGRSPTQSPRSTQMSGNEKPSTLASEGTYSQRDPDSPYAPYHKEKFPGEHSIVVDREWSVENEEPASRV